MTRILVISDSHASSLDALPSQLVTELAGADIVVHCGDYNTPSLLGELRQTAKRFVGVYGNMDPRPIRDELPDKTVFEVEGRRIGVIHPSWGGPPFEIERDIARELTGVDIILFGHTHDVCHREVDGVVFLNPGQAYPSYMVPASAGVLTIDGDGLSIELETFK